MFNTANTADAQMKTLENLKQDSTFELGNSRLGVIIIMTMATFVGVWGTTCLLSGLASCTSYQEICQGFITALTGI